MLRRMVSRFIELDTEAAPEVRDRGLRTALATGWKYDWNWARELRKVSHRRTQEHVNKDCGVAYGGAHC